MIPSRPPYEAGARYYSLGSYYKKTFGEPIRKISLDAHFSCPNIDGTVGRGGCVFCDAVSFSPSRRLGLDDLDAQIDEGIRRTSARFGASKFVAYFQPSTNTYAPVDVLEKAFRIALRRPEIVGLAIGTRPDALEDEKLDLLASLSREKWLSLEIGLQSSLDRTLRLINRGHDYRCFVDAVARARARGLRLGTHLVFGLPGESREDARLTARRVASLGLDSVKLHNLSVVKNTALEKMWRRGEYEPPGLEEYAEIAADALERLPSEMVIERVAGDVGSEFLVAPEWSSRKNAGKNAVERVLRDRGTWQGAAFDPRWRDPDLEDERHL
ncbi:MAG: TIGR01212 family radical SAM protein [Thermoguttaceae bacterium]|nr:TIGR01212 family radical SAM protein [Thermoguttaceae bacterium]